MIQNLIRIVFGYKWEWEEHYRHRYSDGTEFLFICKKTGRIKKVWVGAY